MKNRTEDHLKEIWEQNEPAPSDKEVILDYLQRNSSVIYTVQQVMSEALDLDVLTQDDLHRMPNEMPSGISLEDVPDEMKEKHMISFMASFQGDLARVQNILEDLVYEGLVEKSELPFVDVYSGPAPSQYMSMTEEEVEDLRKDGDTVTFYKAKDP